MDVQIQTVLDKKDQNIKELQEHIEVIIFRIFYFYFYNYFFIILIF